MKEITSFTSECSICLRACGAGVHSKDVSCCNCKQLFHKKCLNDWYKHQFLRNQTKVSCPNCRHYHRISVKCKNQNCLVQFKKREILIWGRRRRSNPAPRRITIQPVNTNNNYFIESETFKKLSFVFVFILIVSLVFVFFF